MKEKELAHLVLKASVWMDNGVPLKDVMDSDQVEYAIHYLSEIFEQKGYYYGEEE